MEHVAPRKKERKKKKKPCLLRALQLSKRKKWVLFSSSLTFFPVEGSLKSSQILAKIFYPYQSLSTKVLNGACCCREFNDSQVTLGLEFNYYLANLCQFLLVILSDIQTCMFCIVFYDTINLIISEAIWPNLGTLDQFWFQVSVRF